MKMNGLGSFVYRITEWIMRLAYIQLLWLAFTIVGLGIFGLFPSTSAMFAVTRKWVMGEREIAIFQTFWNTYKGDFIRSNGLGWFLFAIGYFLYFDSKYFIFGETLIDSLFKIIIMVVFYLFLSTCMFIFPVFVHYQYKFFDYIKYSFLYSVISPLKTASLFITTVAIYYFFLKVPSLILFFSGSFIAVLWMSVVYKIINKEK